MSAAVPWYQSLAWRFFFRTSATILALLACVLWVVRDQSQKRARESAEAGIRAGAQVMAQSLANQARIMDAGLEVFASYNKNQASVQEQDYVSLRDALLENLADFKSDVAMVVRPSGALLSCTTDGFKQDYSDVGIVTRAMHPPAGDAKSDSSPSTTGFFQIEGGTYQGTYLGVARRLQGGKGEFLGVMVAGTRLGDRMAKQLRDQTLVKLHEGDPWSHVTLLAGKEILGSTLTGGRPELARWLAGPESIMARGAAMAGRNSQPTPLRLEGHGQMMLLVPLKGASAGSLQLAQLITVPLEPYLRPFRIIQRTVLWVGLAGMLVAVLIALRTSRAITAPLARLTQAVIAMAAGHKPELPQATEKGEVAALAKGFAFLLAELRTKEELLAALEEVRDAQSASPDTGDMGVTLRDPDSTVVIATTPSGQPVPGAAPRAAARRLRSGDFFAGRYRIERVLGSGGMGVVLKAHDEHLDEDVALKVIRPELGDDPAYLEPLKQEIKLARRISHRYILRTHDFGESDGIPFVSMEYLRGVTLRELLDEKVQLPLPLVLRIGRQIAEGLEAAHAEGVVHRDIKPQNVMFDPRGDVKLMDFGLAAPVSGCGTDPDGHIFGTPCYMAPEQFRGEDVDPRTDFYALGVMLFELATGFAPFHAEDSIQLAGMHLQQPAPDARSLNQHLPEAFAKLLQRLMAKAKEDRPENARDMLQLLQELAAA